MPDGEILHYPDESSDSEGDGDDTDNHVDMEVLHEGTTPEPTVSPPEGADIASLPAVNVCEDIGTVHREPSVTTADHTDSQDYHSTVERKLPSTHALAHWLQAGWGSVHGYPAPKTLVEYMGELGITVHINLQIIIQATGVQQAQSAAVQQAATVEQVQPRPQPAQPPPTHRPGKQPSVPAKPTPKAPKRKVSKKLQARKV